MEFWSIPRCFNGETVAILAGGPSLTAAQVEVCRGRCRMIAINRSYVLAPHADWLYGADVGGFWLWCGGPARINGDEPDALDFSGTKIVAGVAREGAQQYFPRLIAGGVKLIKHCAPRQQMGLSADPGMMYGPNSVHNMMSVIHHTGAKRVILLGVDMRNTGHWHPEWPDGAMGSDYDTFRPALATLVDPLARARVEVLNATPNSALKCWPRVDLAEALDRL